jgi:hypothetical protein
MPTLILVTKPKRRCPVHILDALSKLPLCGAKNLEWQMITDQGGGNLNSILTCGKCRKILTAPAGDGTENVKPVPNSIKSGRKQRKPTKAAKNKE